MSRNSLYWVQTPRVEGNRFPNIDQGLCKLAGSKADWIFCQKPLTLNRVSGRQRQESLSADRLWDGLPKNRRRVDELGTQI